MKKLFLLVLALVMVAAMGFAAAEEETETVTLQIQHNTSENHPWQKGMLFMVDQLEQQYPGVFDATIYPNGSLAGRDWQVILEQTQSNVVQMMCESSIPFATLQSELFALNTPFVFDDMEHYLRFMEDRPDALEGWFATLEDKDVKVLAVWPRPFRQLLNSERPIETPADIEGLPFRVPGLDLFVRTFEAMGARPVPMSSGEIYTAMQLGTVVGEDNSIGTVFDFKTYEQGHYFNVWNYMADGVLVVVNKGWFEDLDADLQVALRDAAQAAANVVYEEELALQVRAEQGMKDFGIEFTYFDAEMKQPFIDLMDPVYSMIEDIVGTDDWNAFMARVEETR